MEIDPEHIKPSAGKLLVEIVEVLGGTRKSGLFVPPSAEDHMGKDTFYGKILKVGPPPQLEHFIELGRGNGYDVRLSGSGICWSKEVMAQFETGLLIVLPRDVPLVFGWESKRYALVLMHEGMVTIDPEKFSAADFEVVPWSE